MHPLLHRAGCIVPCITAHQISQLNPHVLIQSMGISFCIYRLISCQNIDYNYPIWDISARSGLLGVILSDGSFHFPPFFSLLMAAFRDRNQRIIVECTLLWTIAGYRPQCKVPSKVSQNSAWSTLTSYFCQPSVVVWRRKVVQIQHTIIKRKIWKLPSIAPTLRNSQLSTTLPFDPTSHLVDTCRFNRKNLLQGSHVPIFKRIFSTLWTIHPLVVWQFNTTRSPST